MHFAGSRAGTKSVLVVNKLNDEETKAIDEGKIVYDGHEQDPTIEDPKFYNTVKKNCDCSIE
jgi:hypothetical protein